MGALVGVFVGVLVGALVGGLVGPLVRPLRVVGQIHFRLFCASLSSGKKKAHKHKSFWPVTPPVTGGSPDRKARGQSFMYYPRNPRNINLFVRIPDWEDRWPGRPEKVLCAKVLCAFFSECRKWGFKRWGLKQIWGYLRKKALFLRFLDFPGALRTHQKRAKKSEKGRKRPILADFQEGRPDTP